MSFRIELSDETRSALTAARTASGGGVVTERQLREVFGGTPPLEIDADDDDAYRAHMVAQGHDPAELPTLEQEQPADNDPLTAEAIVAEQTFSDAFADDEAEAQARADAAWPACVAALGWGTSS